jgi:hypothetical protein
MVLGTPARRHAGTLGQLGLAQAGLKPGVSQQTSPRGGHFVVHAHVHDRIPHPGRGRTEESFRPTFVSGTPHRTHRVGHRVGHRGSVISVSSGIPDRNRRQGVDHIHLEEFGRVSQRSVSTPALLLAQEKQMI